MYGIFPYIWLSLMANCWCMCSLSFHPTRPATSFAAWSVWSVGRKAFPMPWPMMDAPCVILIQTSRLGFFLMLTSGMLGFPHNFSRWWFQIFVIFTPIWGRFPFWRSYFSDGLVQPPTSFVFQGWLGCLEVWCFFHLVSVFLLAGKIWGNELYSCGWFYLYGLEDVDVSFPIGSMGLVYLPYIWLFFYGKCRIFLGVPINNGDKLYQPVSGEFAGFWSIYYKYLQVFNTSQVVT